MKAVALRLYLFVLLSSLLIATWTGCTGNTGPDDGGAGSIDYRLSWNSTPAMVSHRSRSLPVTGNVCEDYEIEWIHAKAVDQEGTARATGKWPCRQRKGELTGVPAGTYSLRIEGEVAGAIAWRGEVADLQININELTDAGEITMRHLGDQDPPAVHRTVPAHETQHVPIDSAVTATFDEAVVAQSIDAKNFTLTYTDPSGAIQQVEGKIRYEKENLTAVMIPAALIYNTTYTATITLDAGMVVQDTAGNPMQEAFQWRFTTLTPDGEGPIVISRAPDKNTMDVATNAIVQVRFSESVDTNTISTGSVRLERNGTPIQCDIKYDGQLNMVTLTPAGDLPMGDTLTVTVTTDIVDVESNPMAAAESWAFVTQFPPWHTEPIDNEMADGNTKIALETNHDVHIAIRQAHDDQAVVLERSSKNEWLDWSPFPSTGIGEPFDMVIGTMDMRHYIAVAKETNQFEIRTRGLVGGGVGWFPIELSDPLANLKSVSFSKKFKKNSSSSSTCIYDASDAQLKVLQAGTNETVDTTSGEHCAIASSVDGVPHLSYNDKANRTLRYATRTPDGEWLKETLDESTAVGARTAIAPDSEGRPHICYRDESNASLKYAYLQSSGDWLVETVDSSVTIGDDLDIALDSLGQAHISYYDTFNGALKYAVRTGIGIWHTKLVDIDRRNGYGSSITVDSQDYVHISYCAQFVNRPGFEVRYATTRPQN